MTVAFVDPIKDYSLKKLIAERDEWEQLIKQSESPLANNYRQKVVAEYNAEIERRKQIGKINELICLRYAEVLDPTKRCRFSYRAGECFKHLRKDHANITLYGKDGHADLTQSVHISQVEQYLRDHGFDPHGKWFDAQSGEEV